MSNYANEKTFDENLQKIGDLYEAGKDRLSSLLLTHEEDWDSREELFNILREMRDIAAVNLKANHEIKDN